MGRNERRNRKAKVALLLTMGMLLHATFSLADDGAPQQLNKTQLKYVGKSLSCDRKISTIALSPNGQWLVLGLYCKDLQSPAMQVWDTRTFKKVTDLKGHTGNINDLAFSPNGKLLVSTADDATVSFWDVGDWPERITVGVADGNFKSIAFSKTGKWFSAYASKEIVGVWPMKENVPVLWNPFTRSLENSPISRVLVLRDESKVILVGKETRIWNFGWRRDARTFSISNKTITGAVLMENDENDEVLVTSSEDHTVRSWDLSTGKEIRKIVPRYGAHSLAYCAELDLIAIGTKSGGAVQLHDAKTGAHVQTLTGLNLSVESIVFSKGGRMLIAGGGVNHNTNDVFDGSQADPQKPRTPKPNLRVWTLLKKR